MSLLPAGFKYTVETGHLQPLQKSKSDRFNFILPPPLFFFLFWFSANLAIFSSNRLGWPLLCPQNGRRQRLWWAVACVAAGLVSHGRGAPRGGTQLVLPGLKQPGTAVEPVSWRKLKCALSSFSYIQHNFCSWLAFFAVSHCSYSFFLSHGGVKKCVKTYVSILPVTAACTAVSPFSTDNIGS